MWIGWRVEGSYCWVSERGFRMMRRPQFGRENAYLVTEKSAADVEKSDWPRRRWLSEREAQDLA